MANGYLFSGTVNLCGKQINVSVDILNSLRHWLSQCDSLFCVVHVSYLAQALTCLPDLFIARLEIKKGLLLPQLQRFHLSHFCIPPPGYYSSTRRSRRENKKRNVTVWYECYRLLSVWPLPPPLGSPSSRERQIALCWPGQLQSTLLQGHCWFCLHWW